MKSQLSKKFQAWKSSGNDRKKLIDEQKLKKVEENLSAKSGWDLLKSQILNTMAKPVQIGDLDDEMVSLLKLVNKNGKKLTDVVVNVLTQSKPYASDLIKSLQRPQSDNTNKDLEEEYQAQSGDASLTASQVHERDVFVDTEEIVHVQQEGNQERD